jgi:hypothetical protein
VEATLETELLNIGSNKQSWGQRSNARVLYPCLSRLCNRHKVPTGRAIIIDGHHGWVQTAKHVAPDVYQWRLGVELVALGPECFDPSACVSA